MKTSILILMLAVAAALPGCFKLKQDITVMPDGSGKMTMTIAFNKKQLDDAFKDMPMAKQEDTADPTDIDTSMIEGIVAFGKPKEWTTEDGWKYVTVSGYFEDINKVKVFQEEEVPGTERAVRTSYKFEKTEGGFTLECVEKLNPNEEKMAQAEQMPPEMAEMVMPTLEAAMKGMSLEYGFKMPGEVTKAEDCTKKEGRTASSVLAAKDMKSMTDYKKLGQNKHFKLTCGKSAVTDEEEAAFRAEMKEAVAEWKEMQKKAAAEKEAEKKEAEKKDESGEDGEKAAPEKADGK